MMDYITPDVIRNHCDYVTLTNGAQHDIHDDFDFLPFHRAYLEKLEDYLIERGFPQFVPLPKWSPATCTPIEFRVVDPDCTSSEVSCTHGDGLCNIPTIWCPSVSLPNYLSLPINPGPNNDLCDWQMDPTEPVPNNPNCCQSGLSRIIEGQSPNPVNSTYHNSVHGIMSGVMGNFRSPAAPIFWLWHAYVDDIWKTWECNCPQSTTQPVDLYMKDNSFVMQSERDRGEEPSIDPGPTWISEDIWVRNQPDGITNHTHENPEYDPVQPVYVYVRVRNRGCVSSLGTAELKLYWAKAASSLTWPDYWNGNITNPALMGDQIGTLLIPSVVPGGQTILQFTWNPPNPADYEDINDQPHHFCLLTRIEASNDPMYNEQWTGTWNLSPNVRSNNNIVWKNLSIVDLIDNDPGGGLPDDKLIGASIFIGNATSSTDLIDIEFSVPMFPPGNTLLQDAEVRITMNETAWNAWESRGGYLQNLIISNALRRQLKVTGDSAYIRDMEFNAHERGLILVSFNFLSNQLTGIPEYTYNVIQRLSSTGENLGGERYVIQAPQRNGFIANAGPDQELSEGQTVILHAESIGEPAFYNWYDTDGNLIHTGMDLALTPELTQTYKLEVISDIDGLKDYDEVLVKIKEFEILSIAPNPASSNILVKYKAQSAASAYLTLMMPYGNQYNYIVDTSQDQLTVNVTEYSPGVYTVLLICNGQVVDIASLIIQGN